jgi:hypothetical protein
VKITANKCLPLQLEKWTKCHVPLFPCGNRYVHSGFSGRSMGFRRAGWVIDTLAVFLQIIANQWAGWR